MEGLKKKFKISYVAEGITWMVMLLTVVFIRFAPSRKADNETLLMYAGAVLIFALIYYYVLYKILPYTKRQWVKNVGDVILIGILFHIARDFGIQMIALFFMPIAASMFVLGSINSLLIAVLAIVIIAFEFVLNQGQLTEMTNSSYTTVYIIVTMMIAAIYTRALSHQIKAEKSLKEEAENKLAEANQKLVELENLEKEFVSLTAHQLFTPLSVIRGFVSMMLQGDTGKITPKQKKYLQESYHYTLRMIRLIKELLNISRIETGEYKLDLKPIDIVLVLKEVISELQPVASKNSITLNLHAPTDNVPKVVADVDRLPEIFINIIDNAIKYSHEKSQVDIKLTVLHEQNIPYVQIDIQDHGVGIPLDEQQYLFQRFFRATNILAIDNQGSGLGLFIARRLLEQQAGKISFKSEVGKGTTFTIILSTSNHHLLVK